MANGDLFKEIRACTESDEKIPQRVVNRLILCGMTELYEKIEALRPALTTYKIIIWIVSGLVMAVGVAIVTGKMALTIVP